MKGNVGMSAQINLQDEAGFAPVIIVLAVVAILAAGGALFATQHHPSSQVAMGTNKPAVLSETESGGGSGSTSGGSGSTTSSPTPTVSISSETTSSPTPTPTMIETETTSGSDNLKITNSPTPTVKMEMEQGTLTSTTETSKPEAEMESDGQKLTNPDVVKSFELETMDGMAMLSTEASQSAQLGALHRGLSKNESLLHVKVKQGSKSQELTIRSLADHLELVETTDDGKTAVNVLTTLALNIDNEHQQIGIKTALGEVTLHVLPKDAISQAKNAGLVNDVETTTLEENADHQPVFTVDGTKQVKLLGLIPMSATVKAQVNATTGEAKAVNQPWYLNAFGWLFVSSAS